MTLEKFTALMRRDYGTCGKVIKEIGVTVN